MLPNKFRWMRLVVQDSTLIQSLIDSGLEAITQEDSKQFEDKVIRYWKGYSIKSAVDLMVKHWNEVNQTTKNDGWVKILSPVVPERHEGDHEPQTAAAAVKVVTAIHRRDQQRHRNYVGATTSSY